MQYLPIKTRIVQPPQDDLFAVLNAALTNLQEEDVVVISSKIVAIGEGNCVEIGSVDKQALVAEETELAIPRDYWGTPLTIKHNAFIGTAGIDESNSGNYYVLLPKKPFKSAFTIWNYLRERFELERVGVVITDSHSIPMRRGAIGISIGYWGFDPLINHVGEKDLFEREFKIEVANLVDGIAAGANVVMGETNESTPVVIARGVPNVSFQTDTPNEQHMVSFADDTFRVLYQRFLPPSKD